MDEVGKKTIPRHRSAKKVLPKFSDDVKVLARFRYRLRKFLRFSETAARNCKVTPQQHQLLLGVAGYTGRGAATISELAEFLQERHNAVVGLVARAAERGLVRREQVSEDRRVVSVRMTPQGKSVLSRLTKLHREEIGRVQDGMLASVFDGPQLPKRKAEQRRRSHAPVG